MADYPYTTVLSKLKPLLTKIREVGIPPKATAQWLKSVGFTSSNDASLLTVFRFIGLIDSSGAPTDVWRNYRGAQHGQVLANAIRQSYSGIFQVYPDAHTKSPAEISNVVSTTSSAGKQAIDKTVRTFQILCGEADFSATGQIVQAQKENVNSAGNSSQSAQSDQNMGNGPKPSIHINIQVHISPDASPDQIDKIFESMSKHLYKKQS